MARTYTFKSKLETYRAQFGDKSTDWVLAVFTAMLDWLRQHGSGEVTLHAIDHRPGAHLTVRTITKALQPTSLVDSIASVRQQGHGEITFQIREPQAECRMTVRTFLKVEKH